MTLLRAAAAAAAAVASVAASAADAAPSATARQSSFHCGIYSSAISHWLLSKPRADRQEGRKRESERINEQGSRVGRHSDRQTDRQERRLVGRQRGKPANIAPLRNIEKYQDDKAESNFEQNMP